jgi:hypothetical protein
MAIIKRFHWDDSDDSDSEDDQVVMLPTKQQPVPEQKVSPLRKAWGLDKPAKNEQPLVPEVSKKRTRIDASLPVDVFSDSDSDPPSSPELTPKKQVSQLRPAKKRKQTKIPPKKQIKIISCNSSDSDSDGDVDSSIEVCLTTTDDEGGEEDAELLRGGNVDILRDDDDDLFQSDVEESDGDEDGDLGGFVGTHEDDEEVLVHSKKRSSSSPVANDNCDKQGDVLKDRGNITVKEIEELLGLIGDFFEKYDIVEIGCAILPTLAQLSNGFENSLNSILRHVAFDYVKKKNDVVDTVPIMKKMEKQFRAYHEAMMIRADIRLDLITLRQMQRDDMCAEALHDTFVKKKTIKK